MNLKMYEQKIESVVRHKTKRHRKLIVERARDLFTKEHRERARLE